MLVLCLLDFLTQAYQNFLSMLDFPLIYFVEAALMIQKDAYMYT